MNWRKILVPVAGVVMVAVGWQSGGWGGVALVVGGIVMWMLLHFTRTMKVLQGAAHRPIGYCDSAVMVNSKLRPGVNLLHVMALTRAMGEQLSEPGADPEIYRWTDGTASSVTCEFVNGRVTKWTMVRPTASEEGGGAAPAPSPQTSPGGRGNEASAPAATTGS